jgi:cyclic pyranopterin phosphate synthase
MRRMSKLTHIDEHGRASMVDVADKAVTSRIAVAEAVLRMQPATLAAIQTNAIAKGEVLATARIAGIQGAKRTADLIPLCHPLPLTRVAVQFDTTSEDTLTIRAECRVKGQTGVEMEALTAVSIAALTVYDMCKAMDRGMVIEHTRLLSKSGGKSGTYEVEGP